MWLEDSKPFAASLVEGADRVVVEEVRSFRRRSYELHGYRGDQLSKYRL